jgi:hypothetical protein
VQLSGELAPVQAAVAAAPLSTAIVTAPVGADGPVYATLAVSVVVAVPYAIETGLTVTIGVIGFTVSVAVPLPML